MKWDDAMKSIMTTLPDIGFRVLGAILLWVVGKWLIGLAVKLVSAGMVRQRVDSTLQVYAIASMMGLLNIILIVSLLGSFGVQTTSFAAVLAAMGFAIGTAWSGLLSHFAAGVFMIILKPFKVGDFVEAGGVTGTIVEVGPFSTKINSPDNVLTMVGNNKILSDNILNYTANPHRRVDLFMQLNHDANAGVVMDELRTRLATISNVCTEPPPSVEILEFNLNGPKLAVRPSCHNMDYWQVYFDTNRVVNQLGAEHGLAVPEQHIVVRNISA